MPPLAKKSRGAVAGLAALGGASFLAGRIAMRRRVAAGGGLTDELAGRVKILRRVPRGHRFAYCFAGRVDVARGVACRCRFAERATGGGYVSRSVAAARGLGHLFAGAAVGFACTGASAAAAAAFAGRCQRG